MVKFDAVDLRFVLTCFSFMAYLKTLLVAEVKWRRPEG